MTHVFQLTHERPLPGWEWV